MHIDRPLSRSIGLITASVAVSLMVTAPSASAEQTSAVVKTIESNWRTTIRQFAQDNFKHPAWGYSHSQRDYDLAKALAAKDDVTLDDDVLFAAAFLHDIAAFDNWSKEGTDHADRATEVSGKILTDAGFDPEKLDAAYSAMRTHMFARAPKTPEALYLHDADALDWLGSIGVARIIALVDAKGETPDGPAMAQRLRSNLENVPDRIFSPAGRAVMPERRAQLKKFLDDLEAQTKALGTL